MFSWEIAGINLNDIKTLLANGLSTFLVKNNPFLRNGPKSLPKNPSDCPILFSWVLYNFILAEEIFVKSSQSFELYLLVKNDLCGKLFSLLEPPTIFDESFKVTSLLFFIPDLLSCN